MRRDAFRMMMPGMCMGMKAMGMMCRAQKGHLRTAFPE